MKTETAATISAATRNRISRLCAEAGELARVSSIAQNSEYPTTGRDIYAVAEVARAAAYAKMHAELLALLANA